MDSTKNDRINAAMDQLDSQMALNYAAAARDHNIDRTTLARRYKGKTVSRAEANSTYRQRLNAVQEDTLLRYPLRRQLDLLAYFSQIRFEASIDRQNISVAFLSSKTSTSLDGATTTRYSDSFEV